MRRTYPTPSYQGGETHNRTEQSTAQTQEMLEKENDELVHSLKSKVSTMKALAIEMGNETKAHNAFLQGMDGDFDNAGGLLKGSMKRLKGLSNAGHNNWMCYMIVLIVVLFIILYYVIRWRS